MIDICGQNSSTHLIYISIILPHEWVKLKQFISKNEGPIEINETF